MGMLDKLSRLVMGGGPQREATAALQECYRLSVVRAQQLRQHAAVAPQGYSGESLKDLAADEERQTQRLRDALRAAEQALPPVLTEAPATGALNHWARLVQDLQMHRDSARRLRELAMRFAETLPSTAELFDQLCRQEVTHCEHLRGLIARADPQALD